MVAGSTQAKSSKYVFSYPCLREDTDYLLFIIGRIVVHSKHESNSQAWINAQCGLINLNMLCKLALSKFACTTVQIVI